MSEQIAQRVARDVETPDLVELLTRLPGSDLHSLLLAVLKRRITGMEPAQFKRPNAVSEASDVDGRLLHEIERSAYFSASQFEAIELSPLDPRAPWACLPDSIRPML